MKRFFYILTLLIISSTLFFMKNTPTYAQATQPMLRISPAILPLQLDPGTTKEYMVTVENLTNSALPVHVSIENFDSNNEDSGFIPGTPSEESPLVKWTSVSPTDLLFAPKEKKTVTLTVKIPAEVPVGGYYEMIYFSPLISAAGIPVNSKIGLLLLANIGIQDDSTQKAKLLTYDFNKWLFEDNPVTTTIRIQNTSLNYFDAKVKLVIQPLFGKPKEYPLDEKIILPGKVRRWMVTLNLDKPLVGIYWSKLIISTGDGKTTMVVKQFYAYPLSHTLIIITLLAIFLFTIIYNKRIWKAIKLFIKG